MADPRFTPIADRVGPKDHRSDLMKAKSKTVNGEKVNACPFGCTVAQLDENGYCHHLIGFSNDGKTYEPMIRKGDRRVVQVKNKVVREEIDADSGVPFPVTEPVLETVQKDDQLVQITVSHRVYRDKKIVQKQKTA